jgi:hypothetical protein
MIATRNLEYGDSLGVGMREAERYRSDKLDQIERQLRNLDYLD